MEEKYKLDQITISLDLSADKKTTVSFSRQGREIDRFYRPSQQTLDMLEVALWPVSTSSVNLWTNCIIIIYTFEA